MLRVLVIGPAGFAGATPAAVRAFTACGCAARAVEYAYWFPVFGVRRFGSWLRRLHAPSANRYAATLTHAAVMQAAEEHGCDLAFVIIGASVTEKTLMALRRRHAAKTVLWLMDDPLLAWTDPLQLQPQPLAAYDRVYVFDPYYLPALTAHYGAKFAYLPLAFDEKVYRPLPDVTKSYAAVFAGEAFPERKELLAAAGEVTIDTWTGDFSGLANCRQHPAATPAETNAIYNAATVVINRNHRQSVHGNNLRLFEAAGSGACLLTDDKRTVAELLTPGEEVLVYRNHDEFRDLLRQYTGDSPAAAAIGARAAVRARTQHTFTHRMRQVLADCQVAAVTE